jgi:hypothetical protein
MSFSHLAAGGEIHLTALTPPRGDGQFGNRLFVQHHRAIRIINQVAQYR